MRAKLLFGFKGNTFSAITQVCVTQLSLSPATFALTGNRAGTEPAPTHQHDKVEKGTGKVGEKPVLSGRKDGARVCSMILNVKS